jgi:hypothetical protein
VEEFNYAPLAVHEFVVTIGIFLNNNLDGKKGLKWQEKLLIFMRNMETFSS